jgi:hypothetical protein
MQGGKFADKGILFLQYGMEQMKLKTLRVIVASICLSLFGNTAKVAAAQANAQQAAGLQEGRCRAREADLMQIADVKRLQIAISGVSGCPEAGGELLAKRWQQPPKDSSVLTELVTIGSTLRDGRVLNAVLGVLADRSEPEQVRLAALQVAYAYATRGTIPLFRPVSSDGSIDWAVMSPRPGLTAGSVPLLADTYRIVATRAREIAARPGESTYLVKLLDTIAVVLERRKGT